MKPTQTSIDIIRYYEGFSSEPYLCPAGVPTIGYGTTMYPNGKLVTLDDPSITEDQGNWLLFEDVLRDFVPDINELVTDEVTQNQFDAIVSFTYNVGSYALETSTLLEYVNEDLNQQAADEFPKWIYADGEVMPGLVERRDTERSLYLE